LTPVPDRISGYAGGKSFLVVDGYLKGRALSRASGQHAKREEQPEFFHANVSVR